MLFIFWGCARLPMCFGTFQQSGSPDDLRTWLDAPPHSSPAVTMKSRHCPEPFRKRMAVGPPDSHQSFVKAGKKGIAMKKITLGTNFAVFVLFFGVATLEAFQTRNWLKAAFWLAIGLVFLVADNLRREDREQVS